MVWCFGRECKLGWGFNDSLHRLIPVEGEPPNVTSEVKNVWGYWAYNLSSTDIRYWSQLKLFLEPSYRKFLDFEIIFDDNEYWEVHCWFERQRKSSKKLPKYPLNCSHFVSWIDYGVDLWVQFPKTGFPEDRYEVWRLFYNRSSNEAQKKTKCRVLVNYDEIKEMNLEYLLNFMDEIGRGKHSQYDIPVSFWYEKLSQEIRRTVVSNEGEFRIFLSYLYCVYRKIEMKMKKAGYPNILQDMESGEKSFDKIVANLNKAKKDYKLMNRNDFLKMYPVLKRLFFCYTDYIRYSMDNMSHMYEGDHLPGTDEEMKPWLQKLNQSILMKVNGEWIKVVHSFIATPPGYEQVIEMLKKTIKLRNCQVIIDNDADEPYVVNENNTKILFGLVDMKEATANQSSCYFNVLELECPGECTPNLKRWICTKCGEFVSEKNMILFCSCGSKMYEDKLLTCYHPNHRRRRQRGAREQFTSHEIPHTSMNEQSRQTWERNKWSQEEVNGEGNRPISLIATPSGYEQVIQTLRKIPKFKNHQVTNNNTIDEPYIIDEKNKKVLFGLVDMEGAIANHIPNDSSLLELECPEGCTPSLRRWICTTCGDFVNIRINAIGRQFLLCSCGSKRYDDKLLICHHPNHQLGQQREIQNQPEIVHPPVLEMETNQSQVRDEDNLLSRICEQLQKIKIREGKDTSPEIFIALLDLQSKNKNKEETKDILRPLQDLNLDGDTEHLVSQYLDEDN